MSDKVVSLTALGNEPDPTVIECLERLLEMAKDGDIALLVAGFKDGDGAYNIVTSGNYGRPVLRAEMHFIACDIANTIMNGNLDD